MAGGAVLSLLFSIRGFLATPEYWTALSRLGCVLLRRAVSLFCVTVFERQRQRIGRSIPPC